VRGQWTTAVLGALLTLFLLDTIVWGPIGPFGVPLRKWLFLAALPLLGWLVVTNGGVARCARGPVSAPLLALVAWLGIWATAVPLVQGTNLRLSVQDADSLVILAVTPFLIALSSEFGGTLKAAKVATFAATVGLASFVAAVWILSIGRLDAMEAYGGAFPALFGAAESNLYPHQWNVSMRMFWISTLWLVVGFFWTFKLVRGRFWKWGTLSLLLVAVLATMTRGLWLGLVSGLVVLALLKIRSVRTLLRVLVLSAAILIAVAAAGSFLTSGAIWADVFERVKFAAAGIAGLLGGATSDAALTISETDRLAQAQPLIAAWRESPWLGKGFGATAEVVRSKAFPFSFEIAPLEWLLKLGVVGLGGAAILLGVTVWRCLRVVPRGNAYSAAALVAVLTTSMTNPMLFTSVGMGIVMLLFWDMGARAQRRLER
jgi:hypothetical protein